MPIKNIAKIQIILMLSFANSFCMMDDLYLSELKKLFNNKKVRFIDKPLKLAYLKNEKLTELNKLIEKKSKLIEHLEELKEETIKFPENQVKVKTRLTGLKKILNTISIPAYNKAIKDLFVRYELRYLKQKLKLKREIEQKNKQVLDLLISLGLDINKNIEEEATKIYKGTYSSKNYGDVEIEIKPASTMMHRAAKVNNPNWIEELYRKYNADLDVKDYKGRTPLIVAARHNNVLAVEKILQLLKEHYKITHDNIFFIMKVQQQENYCLDFKKQQDIILPTTPINKDVIKYRNALYYTDDNNNSALFYAINNQLFRSKNRALEIESLLRQAGATLSERQAKRAQSLTYWW